MHSAHRLKEGAAFVDDHRVDVVPVTEARWELEIVGRLRGEGVMEPTTAADNRPSPALLLIRAHRAPFRIRSSVLTHILTLFMMHPLSSLRLE